MKSIILVCIALPIISFSQDYYLLGPDEDGCYEEIYQYCICIAKMAHSEYRHCLNFDEMACHPIINDVNCLEYYQFPNQATCISTLWQSIPEANLTIVDARFCIEHGVSFY